ncbi:MAG: hypothetical protein ACPLW5_04265, partial [Candidatus Bathyarchaeales archaeon]
MSEKMLTPSEAKVLQETCDADLKLVNVRLREGEYQHDLAKTIASFLLEHQFPNVKDIIDRRYGSEKVKDIRFVRKIQTILKKMEKGGIIQILPKEKPWDLQKYTLSSFKFQDADKKVVVLASDQQIKQTKEAIRSLLQESKNEKSKMLIILTSLILIVSYILSAWALTQPIINTLIFIPSIAVSTLFSIVLGR